MNENPFPPWPKFDRRCERKVVEILRSGKVNYWTGSEGRAFEEAWSKWLGVKNAVSSSMQSPHSEKNHALSVMCGSPTASSTSPV